MGELGPGFVLGDGLYDLALHDNDGIGVGLYDLAEWQSEGEEVR
jgi:hypothetical protein